MTSPGRHGWWPHGGIHRSVTLHRLPDPWLFKVEPRFVPGTDRVEVTLGLVARAAHPGRALRWSIAGPGGGAWSGSVLLDAPGPGVHAHRFELAVEPPRPWSRERPDHLYALDLACDGGDALTVRFGARTFEVRGTELLLNGRRDHWKGINRHSDAPGRGPVETPASIAEDLALLRALHVNHTRPGHYPVDERLLDALGEAGITVLEEIPVYQLFLGQVTDRALIAEAAAQLGAMIERDKNDPQVLSWSIGNEFGNYLPGADALTRALADEARRLDPSRPVTAVINNVSAIVRVDFALGPVDIIGLNQYYGWYLGDVTDAGRALDIVHGLHPTKPIVATEFGADALAGRRLTGPPGPEPNDDHSYAEEWQSWYLEQQLAQLRARPYLSGTMPWVLADFRYEWSPSTGKPHPVDGMNLKGLVTRDRRTRKAAFDVLERAYR